MSDNSYPGYYLYKRIVQAKLFIDAHYAEPIDLNDISEEAFFSKFHFIRLFKKIYGLAPHRYLTRVRIERAMQLLRLNTPVTETCFAVGFHSLSSFATLFKKNVGVTPSAYLSMQQHQLQVILKKPLTVIPGCFAAKNGWR